MRWGVLGGVWVSVDDVRLTLSPQNRYVLGRLLMEPGNSVPAERLARGSSFTASDQAVNAARVAVSRLRSGLAPAGGRACVMTSATGYAVDIDPWSVDHVVFAHGVRQAQTAGWPSAALRALEAALVLWKGAPFGELRTDPAFETFAGALEEQRRAAVDLWAEMAVRADVTAGLVAKLESAVAEEPLRERRWAALMLAHYRAGNQSAAVRTYDRARAVLSEELGLDPGPDLRRLLTAVLDHEESLEWRPERQRARPVGSGPLTRPTALVGRDTEIADLMSLLERRRVVVIAGLGGVGKSSLALEVATRVARPAWIVPLAGVDRGDRLLHVICQVMGIPVLPGGDLMRAVAERLHEDQGLLVLDNCEQVTDHIGTLVSELVAAAPDARVLATSRVELAMAGAVTFALEPLPTGSRDAPGPAALVAADAALIRPSRLADNWDAVEEICRRADGIPLALELLGAAWADGRTSLTDHSPAVEAAVRAASESLPAESRFVVQVLAALPREVGAPFLARLTELGDGSIRRSIGPALRAGLVVEGPGPSGVSRLRLLEPVREVLPVDPDIAGGVIDDLRRVAAELAAAACPRLIGAIDTSTAVLLDDEHETMLWMLDRLEPHDRLQMACALAPVWGACGRTVDAQDRLGQLQTTADQSDDALAARYWVSRGLVSPALSDRAPLVDRLRWAMEIADREGDDDLFRRAGGELVVGLGWSGRLDAARDVLAQLHTRLPDGNRWAAATLATLASMASALAGDPGTAADELVEHSRVYREIGHQGEVAGKLFIAATLARIAGDEARLRRVLDEAQDLIPDRFCGYSAAGLALERAKLAAADGNPDAGRLLWDAYGLLGAFGEQRMVAICRREIGIWRLAQGDVDGAADLAAAARLLLRLDPGAAAVAVAHLCVAADHAGAHEDGAQLTDAIGTLMEEPGGAPLSRPELAVVQSRASRPARALDRDALAGLLRRIEDRAW